MSYILLNSKTRAFPRSLCTLPKSKATRGVSNRRGGEKGGMIPNRLDTRLNACRENSVYILSFKKGRAIRSIR